MNVRSKYLLIFLGLAFVGFLRAGPVAADAAEVVSRYRVSVQLEVDGQAGHGEGVWELHMATTLTRAGPWSYFKSRVIGEAIPITLGNGQQLLVLRRSHSDVSNIAFGAFIVECALRGINLDSRDDEEPETVAAFRGGCLMSEVWRPMVVAVEVSDQPNLLRLPYAEDGPAASSISEIKIQVETTSEPITHGIVEKFPWIDELQPIARGEDGIIRLHGGTYYLDDFTTGQVR